MAITIHKDNLVVTHQPFDAKGQKVEPEQQVVFREMHGVTPVNVGNSPTVDTPSIGHIPLVVEAAMPAEPVARAMRGMCYTCKHFDVTAFQKLKALWERGTPDQRNALRNIRIALLTTGNSKLVDFATDEEGQIDVEETLSLMGICKALTVVHSDPVIVHPIGTCPDEVCNEAYPNGFHKPKGLAEEKQGNSAYDSIMRQAQGK